MRQWLKSLTSPSIPHPPPEDKDPDHLTIGITYSRESLSNRLLHSLGTGQRPIPVFVGILSPLVVVLGIPSSLSPWSVHRPSTTSSLASPVITLPIPHPMGRASVALSVGALLFAILANASLFQRFQERHVYASTIMAIITFLLHCILAAIALLLGHRSPLELSYSEMVDDIINISLTFLLASLLALDMYLTHDFRRRGSGMTHRQRILVSLTICVSLWLALGGTMFSLLEGWTYVESVFFSLITISTIGFGNMAPTTPLTRFLLMLYASTGIILLGFLINSFRVVILESLEERILRRLDHVEDLRLRLGWSQSVGLTSPGQELTSSSSRRRDHPRWPLFSSIQPKGLEEGGGGVEGSRDFPTISRPYRGSLPFPNFRTSTILPDQETRRRMLEKAQYRVLRMQMLFATFLSFFIWILGGVMFSHLEGWPFHDALYFSFVSLTTIGFGDMVPSTHLSEVVFNFYIFVGLASATYLGSMIGELCSRGVQKHVQYVERKWADEAMALDEEEEQQEANRMRLAPTSDLQGKEEVKEIEPSSPSSPLSSPSTEFTEGEERDSISPSPSVTWGPRPSELPTIHIQDRPANLSSLSPASSASSISSLSSIISSSSSSSSSSSTTTSPYSPTPHKPNLLPPNIHRTMLSPHRLGPRSTAASGLFTESSSSLRKALSSKSSLQTVILAHKHCMALIRAREMATAARRLHHLLESILGDPGITKALSLSQAMVCTDQSQEMILEGPATPSQPTNQPWVDGINEEVVKFVRAYGQLEEAIARLELSRNVLRVS
ncbi:MAG: hypothetical protein DHS80DRAFT_30580 [Piptocephalis tieghemiana]|nr:MAG: hypothetical protein DHS80DRAFT_30580 [Piptocephalis tieghemiana]